MTDPKHTDTSRSGDLVERLRKLRTELAEMSDIAFAIACSGQFCEDNKNTIEGCIANGLDRIEALEAENERLREAMVVMDNTVRELEAARTQGWNEAIEAAADWFADRFSDAVQADCESGVKWLNERAAKAYLKDAPDTLAAIREGEEAIRALSVPAIVEAGDA